MRVIGRLFSVLGIVCYFFFGIWGFILALAIVYAAVGFWGFVIAFLLFPVTLIAAPWYALFHYGTWFPLVISYGGPIVAGILHSIGSSLSGD
jgi:hypothetical protein